MLSLFILRAAGSPFHAPPETLSASDARTQQALTTCHHSSRTVAHKQHARSTLTVHSLYHSTQQGPAIHGRLVATNRGRPGLGRSPVLVALALAPPSPAPPAILVELWIRIQPPAVSSTPAAACTDEFLRLRRNSILSFCSSCSTIGGLLHKLFRFGRSSCLKRETYLDRQPSGIDHQSRISRQAG